MITHIRAGSVFAVIVLILAAVAYQSHALSNDTAMGRLDKVSQKGSTPILGVMVTDTAAVSPVGTNEAQALYEIEFTVQAIRADLWIERATERDLIPDGSDGVEFTIEDPNGPEYAKGAASSTLMGFGKLAGDTETHYHIAEGSVREFEFFVLLDNTEGVAGHYKLRVTGITSDFDGIGTQGDHVETWDIEGFETDAVYVSN